jgi:hypothetical protein
MAWIRAHARWVESIAQARAAGVTLWQFVLGGPALAEPLLIITDDGLDAALFGRAERAGFPRLALSPAVTVLPGRDAWRLFATHGTSPSLRARALGALCGRQPGEEG